MSKASDWPMERVREAYAQSKGKTKGDTFKAFVQTLRDSVPLRVAFREAVEEARTANAKVGGDEATAGLSLLLGPMD